MSSAIMVVLPVIVAIVATILAFIFIVPDKKRESLNKFGQFLHDTVNFKYLIIEKILQATYIFSTAFVLAMGFFMLFYVEEGYQSRYYSTPDVWYGGYGLLTMIVGPIAIRLAYEMIMMAILLVKNVIQINNKLKSDEPEKNVFAAASVVRTAPVAPVVPVAPAVQKTFCTNCGKEMTTADAFCTGCGAKQH